MNKSFDNHSADIQLQLLGSFQVEDKENRVLKLRSNSERALLAYLATESDRSHSRDFLGDLIWPNLDKDKSANNLRVALSRIRKVLESEQLPSPLIITNGPMVKLNHERLWVDVAEFSSLADQSLKHSHLNDRDCDDCIQRYERASELFKGEFLQGLSLVDSLPFLEWVVVQQEKLHRQAINIFWKLADYYLRRGELYQARTYAQRQLELEPWRESAHRQLMRYFAISDQKNAALAQYQRCVDILEQELGITPSSETEELFVRIKRSRERKRPIVPAGSSAFIGRQVEKADIIQMLSQPDCHLLTVVGLGGVGKTRFVTKIISQLEYAFLDGAVFIPLASLQNADRIPDVIANAVGLLFGGNRDPKLQLIEYLEEKEVLLVLDNFEHLIEGASYLEQIWVSCPDLKILVTSRERLGLQHEWLYELRGLPVSEVNRQADPKSPAVELLLTCIHKFDPGFSPDEETMEALTALTQRVGGLPLALELIAPMIRVYSLEEMIEYIDQQEKPGLEPVFERSWILLSQEEQAGLMKLSVFKTPFDFEAAQQVGGVNQEMLAGFVDKSLVQRVDTLIENDMDRSRAIFDIHPLLKQYLAAKLSKHSGISDQVIESHTSYFLDFLDTLHQHLLRPEESFAFKKAFQCYEDLTTAMLMGANQGRLDSVRRGLKFFILYYESYGAFVEGKKFFCEVAEVLQDAKIQENVSRKELGRVLARATFFCGWHLMRVGNEDQALIHYQEALDLARRSQARFEEANTLNALGLIYRFRDLSTSTKFLETALEVARMEEDQWVISAIITNLGENAMMASDFKLAQTYFDAAWDLIKDSGHFWLIIGSLLLQGQLQINLGNQDEAHRLLVEALELSQKYDYRWMKVKILVSLGDLAFENHDWEKAVEFYQQSFDSLETFGSKHLFSDTEERYAKALEELAAEN